VEAGRIAGQSDREILRVILDFIEIFKFTSGI